MRNLCGLKVRHYTARLIDIIEYLALFSGEELIEKIGVTELKAFFLNSMPNSWIKQAYVQGVDSGYVTF